MDWFMQRFNQSLANINEPSNQENPLQGDFAMNVLLSDFDSQSITSEVPPAVKWQRIVINALNPMLDPVDTQSIIFENNIVDVKFVCSEHTFNLHTRDLVISTPGSFTLPVPDTVNLGSSVSFIGWRDLHGNLWIAGTLIGWDEVVSGTLTLTAEWS